MSEENKEKDQKPFNHPDYMIGEGMFNLSKWIRENVKHPDPAFKVGDTVVFINVVQIERVGKDCDGSTLYYMHGFNGGYPESSFRRIEDVKDFVCPKCEDVTVRNGKCEWCDRGENDRTE